MPGFTLLTEDGSLQVYFPFGEREPKVIRGGPVLGRVKRPRDKELTEWAYREAMGIQVSYLLDTFDAGGGDAIDRKIRLLERMMGMDTGSPEPPHLILLGDPPGCIPHDYNNAKSNRWWVEDHTEEDGALRGASGNRVRVMGTITLCEVVQDVSLGHMSPAKAKRKHIGTLEPRYFHVTHSLNTLSKIAAAFKIKGGWKTLARLNKIRDPNPRGGLKVGRKIRLR